MVGKFEVSESSPEEGLTMLPFLSQYRIGSLDWDISTVFRTWFQELALVILIAVLATLFEGPILPIIQDNQGSAVLLIIPLVFLAAISFLKMYESHVLGLISGLLDGVGVYNPMKDETRTLLMHRIYQNLAFLSLLVVTNMLPLAETHPQVPQDLIERERDNWTWESKTQTWIIMCKKFMGSCAMITLYRLYIDCAIMSWKILRGNHHSKVTVPVEVQRKERQGASTSQTAINANIDNNANAAGSSTTRILKAASRFEESGEDTDASVTASHSARESKIPQQQARRVLKV